MNYLICRQNLSKKLQTLLIACLIALSGCSDSKNDARSFNIGLAARLSATNSLMSSMMLEVPKMATDKYARDRFKQKIGEASKYTEMSIKDLGDMKVVSGGEKYHEGVLEFVKQVNGILIEFNKLKDLGDNVAPDVIQKSLSEITPKLLTIKTEYPKISGFQKEFIEKYGIGVSELPDNG